MPLEKILKLTRGTDAGAKTRFAAITLGGDPQSDKKEARARLLA
jgi:hypothetical protein